MDIDTITFIDKNNKSYNSYYDFGFFIESFIIESPTIKKAIVDIPGTSKFLDFSESLIDDVPYNIRNINISLNKRNRKIFLVDYSILLNSLHGKNLKIIHSKEPGFYWYGKIEVKDYDPYTNVFKIDIVCEVEPYKYELTSSNEDWLWNPFSFEDGIINETKDLEVNGELEIKIYGRRQKVVPKFTCDNNLQCIFNGATYNLPSGTHYTPEIEICEGENTLKFIGNGIVTIEYRGGSL